MDETEFRIGVISDTHGLLRLKALEQLRGAHHIIHAGDIGAPGIIEALRDIAPTTAIRGNVDKAAWAKVYPDTQTIRLAGLCAHVVHKIEDLRPDFSSSNADVVIFGHSHRASVAARHKTLFLNPGSAGPRRFNLPITVASLTVTHGRMMPQIHQLLT